MKLYNGLPLYDLVSLSEDERMTKISLVDDPAVEVDFMCFTKEKQPITFSTDELQHKITGCAIWADKPIYRVFDGEECYVRFTKEYIQNLVEMYSKDGRWNLVNLQHNDDNVVDGIVMTEFFIKDSEKGVSPKGFEEVSDGSLFVTYHVTDDKLWDEIYNGNDINGFSIEVYASLEPAEEKEYDIEDIFNSLFVQERDIRGYIDDRKQLEITENGNTYKGQIYSLGKTDGKRSCILQNNDRMEWKVVLLDDIEKIKQLDTEIAAWQTDSPSFNKIMEDESTTTEKTISAPVTTVSEALKNNKVMMLSYYDGENSDGRGFRQVLICHYGYTKKGNEMFIAYQYYGASHSDTAGQGIWRTFLTKRVINLVEASNMEPVLEAPYGFTSSPSPESGTILETAEFLY